MPANAVVRHIVTFGRVLREVGVEVGPGRVLTGLIKRIAPTAELLPADDPGSAGRLLDLASVKA